MIWNRDLRKLNLSLLFVQRSPNLLESFFIKSSCTFFVIWILFLLLCFGCKITFKKQRSMLCKWTKCLFLLLLLFWGGFFCMRWATFPKRPLFFKDTPRVLSGVAVRGYDILLPVQCLTYTGNNLEHSVQKWFFLFFFFKQCMLLVSASSGLLGLTLQNERRKTHVHVRLAAWYQTSTRQPNVSASLGEVCVGGNALF